MPVNFVGSICAYIPGDCIVTYFEYMKYLLQFNCFEDADKKKLFLVTTIGLESYKTLVRLLSPAKIEDKTFDELVTVLEDHFKPKPIEINDISEKLFVETSKLKFEEAVTVELHGDEKILHSNLGAAAESRSYGNCNIINSFSSNVNLNQSNLKEVTCFKCLAFGHFARCCTVQNNKVQSNDQSLSPLDTVLEEFSVVDDKLVIIPSKISDLVDQIISPVEIIVKILEVKIESSIESHFKSFKKVNLGNKNNNFDKKGFKNEKQNFKVNLDSKNFVGREIVVDLFKIQVGFKKEFKVDLFYHIV